MEKRDPYDVTFYVRLYNAAQIVICTLYVVGSWEMGFTFKYLFKCERFDFMTKSQMTQITIAAWLFLGLRVVEFLETIFFVLRKKHNQASFLHIFHHIGSVIQTWLFLVVNAGERTGKKFVDLSSEEKNFSINRTHGRLHCIDQLKCSRDHVQLLFLQFL